MASNPMEFALPPESSKAFQTVAQEFQQIAQIWAAPDAPAALGAMGNFNLNPAQSMVDNTFDAGNPLQITGA